MESIKTYKNERVHLDRPATSVKQLHRYLWACGHMVNVIKWLGKYDIIIGSKSIPTGINCLSLFTISDWIELINKSK